MHRDEKQLRKMKPYPPLATLLAAASLRESGLDVGVFDAMLRRDVAEFEQALDETSPDIVAIVEDNFNFVTKMCTERMREDALAMVDMARSRGCMVVVNGSDAIDHPGRYIGAGADAVVVGEVEPTLKDVAAAWSAGRGARLAEVPGLALPVERPSGIDAAEGGETERSRVRRTAPRPFLDDLDASPLPAWDLVDVAGYREAWTHAHGRLSWNVVTSRGCPYGCNWCAKPIWGRRYAQRSPHGVADELAALRDHVAPDHVWFADDIFGLTPAWIEAFGREVVARDACVPFMMQSRVNLMKERAVAALASAGAEEVWVGVESGAQSVLDAMDKGSTLDQIRSATRNLKAHGIRCCWFVMLGYPGEEWDDILRTRDLIRYEAPDDIGVSVAYPLPGTPFYERVRARVGAQRNWRETDDLVMLFQGAYPSGFYRSVRDLLHAEVASPAGMEGAALEAAWADLAQREGTARLTPSSAAASSTRFTHLTRATRTPAAG
ncbi:MAG: radical SAM protein [Gemmatimonas sp.]|nr:radical SAM protein [Gemmatimonas sp.]